MNNKYDDIDNIILEYFRTEPEIPPTVECGIKNALYINKKSKVNTLNIIKKTILTILTLLTISSGLVFAKDIEQFFNNIFNNRTGISNAINNGYIFNPQMEYIEANNLAIKIENILMDDNNLDIKFTLRFTGQNLNTIRNVELAQIIIFDENKNILYCNNEDLFNTWAIKNNINSKIDDFSTSNINCGLNYYIDEKTTDNTQLKLIYNLSSYNFSYPKSKKLYFNINKILLCFDNYKEYINGNWNMALDMPEIFYTRNCILYEQKESNDEKIQLLEAKAYDTGFDFKLKIQEKQIKQEFDSTLWDEMDQEYTSFNDNEMCENGKHHYLGIATEKFILDFESKTEPLKNIYIENENNQKFYPTEHTSENSIIDRTSDNDSFTYTDTFDITKYNITNTLTIHFQYNGLDKIIILQKK